eukprot:1149663-Rhodomonas_salina.1
MSRHPGNIEDAQAHVARFRGEIASFVDGFLSMIGCDAAENYALCCLTLFDVLQNTTFRDAYDVGEARLWFGDCVASTYQLSTDLLKRFSMLVESPEGSWASASSSKRSNHHVQCVAALDKIVRMRRGWGTLAKWEEEVLHG